MTACTCVCSSTNGDLVPLKTKRKFCTITETLAGILYPPISISLSVRRKFPVAEGWRRNVSFSAYNIKNK